VKLKSVIPTILIAIILLGMNVSLFSQWSTANNEIEDLKKEIIIQSEEYDKREKTFNEKMVLQKNHYDSTVLEIKSDYENLLQNVKIDLENLKTEQENLLIEIEKVRKEKEEIELELKKMKREKDELQKKYDRLLSQQASKGKIAYLTFDDGPSQNTVEILKILKAYNVKATFFVNGNSSNFGKGIYKQMIHEGHAIGNHTYSHDYSKAYTSLNSFLADFYKLENLLYEVTGIKPKIMRYPGGSNNTVSNRYGGRTVVKQIINEMNGRGYVYFDWNVDSTDASVYRQSKSKIISAVLNGSKGKSKVIVLMHDSAPKTTTVQALPAIIEGLIMQGFRFEVITKNSYTVQFLR
jgi:peptidoglycan-N-acetylglucosamine deacetylase